MLAYGLIDYHPAYHDAGEIKNAVFGLKYQLDWLMAAHPEPLVFHAQVGDGKKDHEYWGPPELMTMHRPVYSLT